MHKLAWDDGGAAQKTSNFSVISAQSSDLQRPLPIGGALYCPPTFYNFPYLLVWIDINKKLSFAVMLALRYFNFKSSFFNIENFLQKM